jgi:uncharacterized protein
MRMKPKYILFLFLLVRSAVIAQTLPERSNTLVTDYARILSENEISSLENKLVAFNDSTSTQIAVVLVNSTDGIDIADYSVQLFNKWHIGQEKKNNGVLLLVAVGDRKVFITTGFGIEGVLPDALCKRIIEADIVPPFRTGDYYGGIEAGTNAMMKIVSGEFTADTYMKNKKGKDKGGAFPFAMFFFVLFIIIVSRIGRVARSARRNNLGFWAAWALLNAASSRSRGSWGGFSGGSGWGGGGGGGFGGFGGGSSGGGGAGGSW